MSSISLRGHKSVSERRKSVATELGVTLDAIGYFTIDEAVASTRNCENMIGVAQVPMGVAGPLYIKDVGGCFVPLATTEGALVASVNRGAKALTESGGVNARAFRMGTTRGLAFTIRDIQHGERLADFVYEHLPSMNEIVHNLSTHTTVTEVTVKTVGRFAYVRIVFNTQDAMGMNMATIASDAIASYIEKNTNAKLLSVAGNYDIDKKPAWLNVIRGRGWEVRAECVINASVLEKTLKTTAQSIYDVWLGKCMIGSAMAGSMAFNAHYANIVAALFLATGQDIAHVAEGCLGITTTEVLEHGDLYVSVYLPDLMVGTVGGGTGLATQREALGILNLTGGDAGKNAEKLATIVGSAVLAGEVSLLASLSVGTLGASHQRLARGGTT